MFMKKIYLYQVLFLLFSCHLSILNAQDEDPAKILHFKSKTELDHYMERKHWHFVKNHVNDSIDGEFYLYKKKSIGGGVIYCSIHLEKYMHYQVFFDHKAEYSLVLDYDDFLRIPTGKSRFNESMTNEYYAIKTVEFDDPADTRNKNLFFGNIHLQDHHPDAVVNKDQINIRDYHKEEEYNGTKEDH